MKLYWKGAWVGWMVLLSGAFYLLLVLTLARGPHGRVPAGAYSSIAGAGMFFGMWFSVWAFRGFIRFIGRNLRHNPEK